MNSAVASSTKHGKAWNQYFVSSSFAPKSRKELRAALPGVFAHLGLEPYWAESDLTGEALLDKIRTMIKKTRFGLYDLSGRKPNVFIELGMALALNKPVIITAEEGRDGQTIPEYLTSLGYFCYPSFFELREELARRSHDPWWGFREDYDKYSGLCEVMAGEKCPHLHQGSATETRTYLIAVTDPSPEKDIIQAIQTVFEAHVPKLSPTLLSGHERSDDAPAFQLCNYCQKLRRSSFAVYNLGDKVEPDSSIYLTLGMSLGRDWPRVILCPKEPKLPALLNGQQRFEYESSVSIAEDLWPTMGNYISRSVQPRENPFRLLDSFTEEDEVLFDSLGRTEYVTKILDYLKKTQVVIVHGESGVGKTSLIRAGVLPHRRIQDMGLTSVRFFGSELNPADMDTQLRATLAKLMPNAAVKQKTFGELSDELALHRQNLLVVLDQFEAIYEQDERSQFAALDFIRSLILQTKFKILIGIRQEYYGRKIESTDSKIRLLPDGVGKEGLYIERLTQKQAIDAIVQLSHEMFTGPMATRLVGILSEGSGRPYTPYIQIVCYQLWPRWTDRSGVLLVTEGDLSDDMVKEALSSILDKAVKDIRADDLTTRRVLRSLVDKGEIGVAVRPWVTEHTIAVTSGTDEGTVTRIIDELHRYRLVGLDGPKHQRKVQIVHDFLAQTILDHYDESLIRLRQAAGSLVGNFATVLRANMDDEAREQFILTFARDFLKEYYPAFSNQLAKENQPQVLDQLTFRSPTLPHLVESLLKPESSAAIDESGACLVVDILCQLLLLLDASDRAAELCSSFVEVIEAVHSPNREKLVQAYQADHARLWLLLEKGEPLEEEEGKGLRRVLSEEEERLRRVLSLVQQEQERKLAELRTELGLISHLPLWRVLYRVWRDNQVLWPEESSGMFQRPSEWKEEKPLLRLFSYSWVLAPIRDYLEQHQALDDRRTYQGVIVHIPAGEHAMRNQRVARQLMIRTVAVEKSARTTAPGWHEADDKKLIATYSDKEFRRLLREVAQDYAVMLNQEGRLMWVILEAQEYRLEDMVNICTDVGSELSNTGYRIEGAIVADVGASIANRKDLTRGLASMVGIPQPAYRVLTLKPETTWKNIWEQGMKAKGVVIGLDDNWNKISEEDRKRVWLAALREAVQAVGGSAMVKPVTTEFLKGATPVAEEADLERAWQRSAKMKYVFPEVLVEQQIPRISKELLVTIVKHPDGHFVNVPPVWYQCVRDYDWQADMEGNSVPVAMDYAWVSREESSDQAIFETARGYSVKMAEKLWEEIESTGYKVRNHFLQFEWFVLDNDGLLLNEIKPTQLDKGIISNVAFSHSDSELLVRNLFGLPLPDEVRLIRPDETILVGAVLTKNHDADKIEYDDIAMICRRGQILGYEGISDALELGASVTLYPDKMRSVPYIGRRMGILTVSGKDLNSARRIFEEARAALKPQYQLPIDSALKP